MSHKRQEFPRGPVGFWFLNDRLEPAVLERQLDEFARQGFSGVVLHPRDGLRTPYLSETWFRSLETIVTACRARGLQAWFYDENPYPSGTAGGHLLNRYPHLIGQTLMFHSVQVQAHEGTVYLALPGTGRLLRVFAAKRDSANRPAGPFADITAFAGPVSDQWCIQGERVQGYGPTWVDSTNHPHWRAWANHESWTLDWPADQNETYQILTVRIEAATDSRHGHYVDLLNPETGRRFIELTHQKTLERLSPEVFGQFAAVFTDEPHLVGPYPWTERLPEDYRQAFGRDFFTDLPHLALEVDAQSCLIRYQYRQLLSRLYDEAFFQPIARWCRERNIPFTGHISAEEEPILQTLFNAGLPRLTARLDWPGCDLILQPFGPAESAKLIGPKLVASIAHQQCKPHLMTEILGCGGEGMTIQDMRNRLHWMAICGFDTFVLHGQFYSLDGHRKREAPPSIFCQAPYWRLFHQLSSYLSGLSDWLTRGIPDRPIAVLLPLAAFDAWVPVQPERSACLAQQISDLLGQMMSAGLDFDLVTDEDLVGATIAANDGPARFTVGAASYQALVIPPVPSLPATVLEALRKLQTSAVRIESLTAAIQTLGSNDGLALPCPHPGRVERLVDRLVRQYRSWISFPTSQKLYVHSRMIDGQRQRMLWNPTETPVKVTLLTSAAPVTRVIEPWQMEILTDNEVPTELPALALAAQAQWEGTWSLIPQDLNTLVLSRWQLQTTDGTVQVVRLPARSGILPWGLDHQKVRLHCELRLLEPVDEAELWFERSTFGGPFELFVNGQAIGQADPVARNDLHERRVPIGRHLTTGLNRIEVVVEPVRPHEPAILDPLRLVGTFQVLRTDKQASGPDAADVRPEWLKPLCADDPAVSVITAGKREVEMERPGDWTQAGYPQYSGTISYRGTLHVHDASSRLFLSAPAHQTDVFDVQVNGIFVGACAWSPWRLEISKHVRPGPNSIEIRVSNTSINRIEGKAQPSGLVGLPSILTCPPEKVHPPSKLLLRYRGMNERADQKRDKHPLPPLPGPLV